MRNLGFRAALLFLSLASTRGATEFFVDPGGNDANPGTRSRPFATLERARQEVQLARPKNSRHGGGVTIWLRGGDYVRTSTFELGSADSGTAAAPIIWRAWRNESVRLLGGRRLTGFASVTDPAVLARLPEEARPHVLQLDLAALGIRDFGEMKSRGFSRPTTPAHCELFYGGRPMTLARYPNEGTYERIAGFPESAGQKDEHGGKLGQLQGGFFYQGDQPRRWKDLDDLWVHGYWSWDWANSYEHVAELDVERRWVKTAAPYGLYGFRVGQRFWFLNILEELDQPGEWFLDRRTARLYFWPPKPLGGTLASGAGAPKKLRPTPDAEEVVLSLLAEPLVKLTEASCVTLRGLWFEATRGNAIEIHGGTSNSIAGCRIQNIGDTGVAIEGGTGHAVISCDIFDTGDGGVSLSGGDRRTLAPAGHVVDNCHFARQGRWSKCYVPAVLMTGVGLRASHNLIHDHPHCAILYTGNDHLIEFNEIHHVALETGDVGAIYTGRDYTFRGNRIRHNFIHHTGGVGMGSMGAYMDDCVSGTEISGNIFYRVQRAAFLGGGRDHVVTNNIFVECNHAVELDGRGLDKSPVWRGMVDDTMRRSLTNAPLALYRQRYPAMQSLDQYYGPPQGPAIVGADFKGVPPDGNLVARNVCVGKWLNVYWHAKPEWLRLENNLTNANPHFVRAPGDAAQAADFALRSDSPAWPLGFQAIPVQQIGLQQDALRRSLPR